MKKYSILLILFFSFAPNLFSQQGKVYNLRNCQKEMRTFTFQSQVNVFVRIVSKNATLDKQRVLNFSSNYKLDTTVFENQIEKIRKTLPVNFFHGFDYGGGWYDTKVDEKEISFTEIFAQKDAQGNFEVYSVAKIIFEGTDARIENQRMSPQIKDIQFIFDKTQLDNIGKQLKASKEVGERH